MLDIQREHIEMNINEEDKEMLFSQIDVKQENLNNDLSISRGSR